MPTRTRAEEEADVKSSALLAKLGERVRERRRALGLSLKALGEIAGVSERFLVLVEAGKANISVLRLDAIARTLRTSAADLLDALINSIATQ